MVTPSTSVGRKNPGRKAVPSEESRLVICESSTSAAVLLAENVRKRRTCDGNFHLNDGLEELGDGFGGVEDLEEHLGEVLVVRRCAHFAERHGEGQVRLSNELSSQETKMSLLRYVFVKRKTNRDELSIGIILRLPNDAVERRPLLNHLDES